MIDELTYPQLIENLTDPEKPLFGGSLSYIAIEECLSMLIKLLSIKIKKPSDATSSYEKMILISKDVRKVAHEMIEKDGNIFNALRKAESQATIDMIVVNITESSLAFITNIRMINDFVKGITFLEKGSIVHDFSFINKVLSASTDNLVHILKYEIKKMTDSPQKEKWLNTANSLLIDPNNSNKILEK